MIKGPFQCRKLIDRIEKNRFYQVKPDKTCSFQFYQFTALAFHMSVNL